jgi:hypothetical protein
MVLAVVVVVALVGLFGASLFVGRFREAHVPAGDWSRTDEVFIDPSTSRRMRVWVDPQDGTRHYVAEGEQPGHV